MGAWLATRDEAVSTFSGSDYEDRAFRFLFCNRGKRSGRFQCSFRVMPDVALLGRLNAGVAHQIPKHHRRNDKFRRVTEKPGIYRRECGFYNLRRCTSSGNAPRDSINVDFLLGHPPTDRRIANLDGKRISDEGLRQTV